MAVPSVTIPIQTNSNSLGNVRTQASQARKDSPSLSGAVTNVQDQIDQLLKRTASVTITATDLIGIIPDDNAVTINGDPVTF